MGGLLAGCRCDDGLVACSVSLKAFFLPYMALLCSVEEWSLCAEDRMVPAFYCSDYINIIIGDQFHTKHLY